MQPHKCKPCLQGLTLTRTPDTPSWRGCQEKRGEVHLMNFPLAQKGDPELQVFML